jgi:flavin reductase (DIM6/NTAB) family NADH-FMN oxidoreductase RutF
MLDEVSSSAHGDKLEGPAFRIHRVYEKGKFDIAGLTPVASETIQPRRALECPVQREAVVAQTHGFMQDTPPAGALKVFEVRIQRVLVPPSTLPA